MSKHVGRETYAVMKSERPCHPPTRADGVPDQTRRLIPVIDQHC
jgi:hypothetical protein